MNKQQRVSDEIHQSGELFTKYKNLKHEYRERLAEQVLKLQEMFGKGPSKNKMMANCLETKVKPHGFHLHANGDAHIKWFSKLNYVGVNQDDEPYVKYFLVGRRKYQSVLVRNMKFIDDIAKVSDYFKITYNI